MKCCARTGVDMPPRTTRVVVKQIEDIFTDDIRKSAQQVLDVYLSRPAYDDPPKIRRVQEIIQALKVNSSGHEIEDFKLVEWKPWAAKCTNAATSAFLLTMDAVCLVVQRRHLYGHEAKWGRRLRVSLQALTPYDQFCFVTLYANREIRAHYDEGDAVTADLDAILAYRPWLTENAHAYGMAIAANLAIRPWALTRQDRYLEDSVKNFFVGKAWETLRVDLRPPWFITPGGVEPESLVSYDLRLNSFLQRGVREMQSAALQNQGRQTKVAVSQEVERMVLDTTLQFWMGDAPIFEKPLMHGFFELVETQWLDIEVSEESNTQEGDES